MVYKNSRPGAYVTASLSFFFFFFLFFEDGQFRFRVKKKKKKNREKKRCHSIRVRDIGEWRMDDIIP